MFHNRHILFIIAFAAAVFAASGAATFARAGETTQRAAAITLASHYDDGHRVCCQRGGHHRWTSYRQCRWARGHVTANRVCRRGRIGYRDYNDDDNRYARVCCRRHSGSGYNDWETTYYECRRAGGRQMPRYECHD